MTVTAMNPSPLAAATMAFMFLALMVGLRECVSRVFISFRQVVVRFWDVVLQEVCQAGEGMRVIYIT